MSFVAVISLVQGVSGTIERHGTLLANDVNIDANVGLAHIQIWPLARLITKAIRDGILGFLGYVKAVLKVGRIYRGVDGNATLEIEKLLPRKALYDPVKLSFIANRRCIELDQYPECRAQPDITLINKADIPAYLNSSL